MEKKRYCIYLVIAILFIPALQAKEKTFTIVIDAGHGGHDAGAKGSSVDEKVINLSVALKLGNLISENIGDVKVVYTRKTDRFIGLNDRAEIANQNKANLFVSIHSNSLDAKSKRSRTIAGTETYFVGLSNSEESLEVAKRENSVILLEEDYLKNYEGFDPNSAESYIMFSSMNNRNIEQSRRFASAVQTSFKKVNRNDREVRQAGFLVLRKTSMPSVLIELGFLSNAEEEKYLKSAAGQNELAKAIYSAFLDYKREYDKNQVRVTPPPTTVKKTETGEEEKIYKIQILASKTKIVENSRFFKGYKNVETMEANGYYRYMYGNSSSLQTIQKLHKEVLNDFKDAFIVTFVGGKVLNSKNK